VLRFASLGSGSKGNAALIEAGPTRLLVDCGFSVSELDRRLARLGRQASELTAIVITHEHADHIGGAARVSRRYRLPVFLTAGTHWAVSRSAFHRVECFSAHQPFVIGDVALEPVPVPHDAREPCQFVFGDGQHRVGLLTDVGSITPHIEAVLSGCDALLLECNYDAGMLAAGPYPASLKQRVASRYGHLDNEQAAELLRRIDTSRLQHLVGMHLSENNNSPEVARAALGAALGCDRGWVGLADQQLGFDWRELR
jgi:phosphoribosyl 1,2-cyclic phosphodiesterase